jgi:hypothetical protein
MANETPFSETAPVEATPLRNNDRCGVTSACLAGNFRGIATAVANGRHERHGHHSDHQDNTDRVR